MRRGRQVAIPFLTIGIALIGIGISSNRTMLYAGVPFLVIGFVLLARGGR